MASTSDSGNSAVVGVTRCCVNLKERLMEFSPSDLLRNPFRRWETNSSHCEDNVCYAFSSFLGKDIVTLNVIVLDLNNYNQIFRY